ncbi:MAG: oxygen-independent coproporphyrinogen III oxidase-like protein [Rubrivivax sp.]|nr:oxygen-independent coproporphyrinogen III oxidase-like protein [Rubrivivax sp.]
MPDSPPLPSPAAPPLDVQRYIAPGPLRLPSLPPLSVYVHIPWCLRKCPYCDFNSHALKAGEGAPEARYIDALTADLEAALPLVWGRTVHSVFIGGGTPSLFSPEAIDRLIAMIRARLMLDAGCEITLEANPGTFEKERFRAFRGAGVTRLSIGVQSFNDRHLKAIGRVHDAAQARAAAEEAARSFETFNLDLMYALPGQSLAELEEDVRTALCLAPPHLSIYHLTVEPNTLFAKYPPRLPDGDTAWEMLDRVTELTTAAGLARYEVSAYARTGHHCVHNTNYWQFGDYLGLGAGAHGKLSFAHRVVRQVRFRDPRQYMEHALAGNAVAQEHEVGGKDLAFEFMLNALRLKSGFLVRDFCTRTGQPVTAITQGLKAAEAKGLLKTNLVHIQPTEKGFDFLSDLQELFLPA